jgi:hypothetical protein
MVAGIGEERELESTRARGQIVNRGALGVRKLGRQHQEFVRRSGLDDKPRRQGIRLQPLGYDSADGFELGGINGSDAIPDSENVSDFSLVSGERAGTAGDQQEHEKSEFGWIPQRHRELPYESDQEQHQ